MRNDHLTYRRATSISVFGLLLQLALGVALLLYGLFGPDGSAVSGAILILLGALVWLGLALIFHQHALERIEAFETEALESQGAFDSSVFEGSREEIRVAARRLEWMHRFLTPAISLIYAASLISIGVVRFLSQRFALNPEISPDTKYAGWAIAIGVGLAATGFVFARFVAGMAKQKEWSNLRSGAAVSVGASIVGLLVAIAQFLEFLDAPMAFRYLHVVLPGLMVVLGVEVVLNFILNLYRPRRKGESPKPAFESRILTFFAAPDRLAESVGEAISYQFGFDVTESWFYRLLSRTLGLLFISGGLVLWGLSAVAIVEPNEQGLVLRFGSLQREVGPGAHFKYPWPVETLETYPTTSVTELEVGSHPPHGNDPILWTNEHLGAGHRETFFIVQPGAGGSELGPRDLSLVAIQAPVHYVIEDLTKFDALAQPDSRRRLLESVAERTVMEFIGSRTIDEVLGYQRSQVSDELSIRVQQAFNDLDAGVRVLFAGIVGAHPPQNADVAKAYERVTASEQRREKAIEDARTQRIRILTRVVASVERSEAIVRELDKLEAMQQQGAPDNAIAQQELTIESLLREAGGEAAQLILTARAERWRLHMNERSRVARQGGRAALYRAAPQVYLANQWFEALKEMLSESRVYVTTFESPRVRVNVEDAAAIGGAPTVPNAPKE
jgi:regulator of protease activity HflC (stomatin/prohibitin superfamily)